MRRTLQELTIKDGFMFAAVMLDSENCRQLLERVLSIPIERVEIDTEKSLIYSPDYKGVRLDVYAREPAGAHFNVEMQVATEKLEKRARYYHSQMDMNLLSRGVSYDELPDCFVIFICDFDPFGLGKYKYTVKQVFAERETRTYLDGRHTIFLSTKGRNDEEVPAQLVNLLHYVGASLQEADAEYDDEYVRTLQKTVKSIKQDREMGVKFMLFEDMLKEEHKVGKAEGRVEGRAEGKASCILSVLERIQSVPEELCTTVNGVTDEETLDYLFNLALSVSSIEEFIQKSNL